MKLEIAIILLKLLCVICVGIGTTLGSNLASATEPITTKMWIIIIAACTANAGKDVISFLSQSFGDFKAQLRANAGQPPMPPPPAQVPVAPGADGG